MFFGFLHFTPYLYIEYTMSLDVFIGKMLYLLVVIMATELHERLFHTRG